MRSDAPTLPAGVRVIPLVQHTDVRGTLVEVFRENEAGVSPVQWNIVTSNAGVLRGVHVHRCHTDYLVMGVGATIVGLRDIRRESSTCGQVAAVRMSADSPSALVIPPGVAHGFFFEQTSVHVYAVSAYWDTRDEIGCHWQDRALAIPWEIAPTELSNRDRAAGSFQAMVQEYERAP